MVVEEGGGEKTEFEITTGIFTEVSFNSFEGMGGHCNGCQKGENSSAFEQSFKKRKEFQCFWAVFKKEKNSSAFEHSFKKRKEFQCFWAQF